MVGGNYAMAIFANPESGTIDRRPTPAMVGEGAPD
jgi:hypothetical protein